MNIGRKIDSYDVEIIIGETDPISKAKKIYYIKNYNVDKIEEYFDNIKLFPIDLKARTILTFSSTNKKEDIIAIYSFLIGFTGRRLDYSIDGKIINIDRYVNMARKKTDLGRDVVKNEEIYICEDEGPDKISIKSEITDEIVSLIRYTKKLTIHSTEMPLEQELLHYILISSIRIKEKAENLPMYNNKNNEFDMDAIRKRGSEHKKAKRNNYIIEIIEKNELSERQKSLIEADNYDISKVITFLGSEKNEEIDFWRCTRPDNHRNGDLNPSMLINENKIRCYRCDTEEIGPVRLIIETLDISPDEAIDLINKIKLIGS